MYIHALVTIVLERAWAALKCDQLPVGFQVYEIKQSWCLCSLNQMTSWAKLGTYI